ncbi:MAG: fibronectin type III domain-containing protein, partial [Clostridia bacterium]|nr:fibronectin type III domain-containing protein [Clostridia bacterium]
AKKFLSVALTLAVVFSVASVAAITASADDDIIYDENVAVSYDPWSRDYAYGTGKSANSPRKITYNNDGWMRVQSQTEEDIAKEGVVDSKQWQVKLDANTQLSNQFKNAVLNDNAENFYFYGFINNAEYRNENGEVVPNPSNFQVQISINYVADGVEGETKWMPSITLNKNYGFRFVSSSKSIPDELKDAKDVKLTSFALDIQDYDIAGIAKLDMFIAPLYTQRIPGTMVDISCKAEDFDAKSEVDASSFIYNNTVDVFYPADFQWEFAEGEEPIKPDEDKNSIYKRGRVKRYDETAGENYDLGYPVLANGSSKTYLPYTVHTYVPETQVGNFKNTAVTTTTATFTWDKTAGGDAKEYFVVCINTANNKDKIFNKVNEKDASDKVVTTATISGLTSGATYKAYVIGYNIANLTGGPSNTITFTTKSTVTKPAAPVISKVAYSAKNQITVAWKASTGATSYDVYRGSTKVATVTGTSYKDTVKTAGTVKYQVVAKNSAGSSAKSAAKSIKTMSFTAKATVKGTPAKKAVTVKVSKAVTNADGYEYTISLKSNMKSAKKKVTTKASFKFTGLKSKKVYYARVRAYKTINGKKVYGAYSKTVKLSKTK